MMYAVLLLLLALSPTTQQPSHDVSAQFQRGVALQQQGRLEEAAAAYRELLKVAPNYAEAHANLGAVLARLGRHAEAIAAYEAALKINPNLTPVYFNLGLAHYRANHPAAAVAAFRQLLSISPTAVQARQMLGIALVELGRDEEAVAELEQTLDTPPDAAALYSLGLAYVRLHRTKVNNIIARLESFPAGAAAAHLLRGQMWLARFEFEKAVEELKQAQAMNPELPRLNYSLGLAYYKLGRNQEALAAFTEELRRQPQDTLSVFYLALLNEADGRIEEARRQIEIVRTVQPDSPEVNALYGKILLKQGKAAEAVAPLELAIKHSPDDAEKRLQLARAYQQSGRRQDAAREFAAVQKLKQQQLERDRANTPKP